jgi:hypothetical protein
MKKIGVVIGFFGSAMLFSTTSHAFLSEAALCAPEHAETLRSEITEEEGHPFFYQNPYTVEGCDLGFDFPGFSLDINIMAGLDWCSLAKNVTSSAREKWNDAVDDVEQWTNNTINANLQDGVSVNDDNIVGGVGNQDGFVTGNPSGGVNYSNTYTPRYDDRGFPIYD